MLDYVTDAAVCSAAVSLHRGFRNSSFPAIQQRSLLFVEFLAEKFTNKLLDQIKIMQNNTRLGVSIPPGKEQWNIAKARVRNTCRSQRNSVAYGAKTLKLLLLLLKISCTLRGRSGHLGFGMV